MIKASRLTLLTCIFAFALVGCVYGPHGPSGRVVVQGDHGMIDIAFSDHDREAIRDYYGDKKKKKKKSKKKHMPPGLAKKGKLPPGLQYRHFPKDLERRLSHIPNDYLRVMIGGGFVLFNKRTQVIFDVMNDL